MIKTTLLITFLVFSIGCFGVLTNRRNIIMVLMGFEIMYLGANLNFAYFTYLSNDVFGVVILIYTLTIIGAESCLGLSIIAVYYSTHKDITLISMDRLRGV